MQRRLQEGYVSTLLEILAPLGRFADKEDLGMVSTLLEILGCCTTHRQTR